MSVTHESVMYDVHDFKVYPLTADTGASPTYGAAVDVPGIATVSLDPNLITAELKGDAKVIAKRGRIDKVACSATYGKVSLDVLEVVLGGTTVDNGGVSASMSLSGNNSLPYFKAAFAIDDADVGSIHVTFYKAQLTGGTLIGGQTDQFGQPTLDLEGIPATSDPDVFFEIEFFSAQTPLPS